MVVIAIGSVPIFILGVIIWKFKLVDIIAGYDKKKVHDKDGMARWVGINLILLSLMMVGLYFVFENVDVSTEVRVFVPIGLLLLSLSVTAIGTRMYENN